MKLVAPEELGFSSDRLARVGARMRSLVDQRKIAGAVTLVARHGKVAHFEPHGLMDVEAGKLMSEDAIFRIFSMTKPVTAVATMMLFEEGHFLLDDPISAFIPEFAETKVLVGETSDGIELADLATPITIRHLLTHTSGLTYHFNGSGPVERMYNDQRILWPREPLSVQIPRLARIPLVHQPGTKWTYSVSLDVLGYLVEVVSGQSFDAFLEERVFGPLEMPDTGFDVPRRSQDRLVPVYTPDGSGGLRRDDSPYLLRSEPQACFSGGGGLSSTTADYSRFAQMLVNGGELDGVRLLGPRTVDLMMADHLSRYRKASPQTWAAVPPVPDQGYGLGGAVITSFGESGTSRSVGSYSWGGAASTSFWVDPKEDLVGLFMTQLMPADFRPASLFEPLVYQALMG